MAWCANKKRLFRSRCGYGDIAEKVAKLKQEQGPDLHDWGSGDLLQTLIKRDLVDVFWLMIYPVTLGDGKRLFADGTIPTAFKVTESIVGSTGVIAVNYERAGEVKVGVQGNRPVKIQTTGGKCMAKLIAAMNMTLDGFCDHTAMIADEEIHQHYTELLNSAGTVLYGRITVQLMEYWASVVKNPTGVKSMDDFAVTIGNIPKIVFSRTLKNLEWKTARLATRDIKEEVLELKQQAGKDILVGSPSLIVALTQLDLIDEYQLGVQPTVLGSGLPLFKNIKDRIDLKLVKTKTFSCGAITLSYEATKK